MENKNPILELEELLVFQILHVCGSLIEPPFPILTPCDAALS